MKKIALIGLLFAISPSVLADGKALYTTNCATCHGDAGDGMGVAGAYMNPKPRNFAKDTFKHKACKKKQDEACLLAVMKEGLTGTAMVAYAHLPEADRKEIAKYIVSTFPRAKK